MDLKDYILPERILFLGEKNKHSVLDSLVRKAYDLKEIDNRALFKKAIEDREALISTGIGISTAIPHAKLDNIEKFFVLMGVLNSPVDWDSIDQKPVSIVFLIGGPTQQQTQYLKLLAQIMIMVKNEKKRNGIINAKNSDEVMKTLF